MEYLAWVSNLLGFYMHTSGWAGVLKLDMAVV